VTAAVAVALAEATLPAAALAAAAAAVSAPGFVAAALQLGPATVVDLLAAPAQAASSFSRT
jgi:hypothetical protein